MSATKLIFYLLVLVTINTISCKTTSTEPVIDPIIENPPGTRNYEWTIDTLNTPSVDLYRLWGASYDDLWVVGYGGVMENFVWHYNGKQWARNNFYLNGRIVPFSIWGFSGNDIWMTGYDRNSASIWHGDGLNWKPHYIYNSSDTSWNIFYNIWGESSNNIYAVGSLDTLINNKECFFGLIFHYDGKSWEKVKIESIKGQFLKIYKEKNGTEKYYILSSHENPENGKNFYKIYELDGEKITEIYSLQLTVDSFSSMINLNGKIYFSLNKDICCFSGAEFVKIKTIEGINRGEILGGRNVNDLFFAMPEGLGHYNGDDFQIIYKVNISSRITDMVIFDEKIILLSEGNNGISYIIKGIKNNN